MTDLTPAQLEILTEVEKHIIHPDCDSQGLMEELLILFPEFTYEGPAFRAIRGVWKEGFKNISWSLTKEAALLACKTWISDEEDISIYQGEIRGFDLHLLVQHLRKNEIYTFHSKLLHYHEQEKEILAAQFTQLILIPE